MKSKYLKIGLDSDLDQEEKIVPLVQTMQIDTKFRPIEALDRLEIENEEFGENISDLPKICPNWSLNPPISVFLESKLTDLALLNPMKLVSARSDDVSESYERFKLEIVEREVLMRKKI